MPVGGAYGVALNNDCCCAQFQADCCQRSISGRIGKGTKRFKTHYRASGERCGRQSNRAVEQRSLTIGGPANHPRSIDVKRGHMSAATKAKLAAIARRRWRKVKNEGRKAL